MIRLPVDQTGRISGGGKLLKSPWVEWINEAVMGEKTPEHERDKIYVSCIALIMSCVSRIKYRGKGAHGELRLLATVYTVTIHNNALQRSHGILKSGEGRSSGGCKPLHCFF